MVGWFDAAHCDTCGSCAPPILPCTIHLTPDFSSVCVSGFTLVSSPSRWQTSTPGAMQLTAVGSGYPTFRIVSTFRVTWTTVFGTVKFRLIGGAVDCDNYWFVELDVYGGNASASNIRVHLGRVQSGIDNYLRESPYDVVGNDINFPPSTGTDFYDIEICYGNEGHVSALISGNGSPIDGTSAFGRLTYSDLVTYPVVGQLAGFKLVSISGASSVAIGPLNYIRVATGCDPCPPNCCIGAPPQTVVVELTDPTPPASPGGICPTPGSCAAILGTTVLNLGQDINPPNQYIKPGDAVCYWGKEIIYGGGNMIRMRLFQGTPVTAGKKAFQFDIQNFCSVLGINNPMLLTYLIELDIDVRCEDILDTWIDFTGTSSDYCGTIGGTRTQTLTGRLKFV